MSPGNHDLNGLGRTTAHSTPYDEEFTAAWVPIQSLSCCSELSLPKSSKIGPLARAGSKLNELGQQGYQRVRYDL